jgi:hypothetical protein
MPGGGGGGGGIPPPIPGGGGGGGGKPDMNIGGGGGGKAEEAASEDSGVRVWGERSSVSRSEPVPSDVCAEMSVVSMRRHTAAYVSIRQHTAASIRQHACLQTCALRCQSLACAGIR